MAGKRATRNAEPVSDLVSAIVDPVLRRRTGVSIGLVQSWEEIAGERVAAHSMPEKILWPKRLSDDDPFEPATLVIACEGFAALALQHETAEVIARINAFLGFPAIGRIRIVQKSVLSMERLPRAKLRALTPAEEGRLAARLSDIEDEGLRAALEKLGRGVIAERR